jgi:hypothetical protein
MPRNSLKKTHTVLEIETANKAKVLEARKRRIRGVVEELTPAAGIGAAWGAIIAGIKNPSFSKGCAIIAGGAATVLAINTLNEYSKGSQSARSHKTNGKRNISRSTQITTSPRCTNVNKICLCK